jgi:hypothetical protein
MKIDLSNKTGIVTGSTAGIGFATARGLAESGATVVVNGRTKATVDETIAALTRVTANLRKSPTWWCMSVRSRPPRRPAPHSGWRAESSTRSREFDRASGGPGAGAQNSASWSAVRAGIRGAGNASNQKTL